jgi:hypothetical protein
MLGLAVLRALLVARDVVVDRRDLLAADARDRVGVVVLGPQPGEVAGEVARLLLLEEQALDVRAACPSRASAEKSTMAKFVVGELLGDRRRRVAHEEAHRDRQVVCCCADVCRFGM